MPVATVGHAEKFCHWVELTRRLPLALVESRERRVPLFHEYREDYLIEVVRELAANKDTPALIFVFGRERCFDTARLFKSCRRFTSDEEKARIEQMCDDTLGSSGASSELRSLLGPRHRYPSRGHSAALQATRRAPRSRAPDQICRVH